MHPTSLISIPGHRGMAGSAIKRNLESKSYHNIITRTHSKLDLTNQQVVNTFFETERPKYVFLAAAKVGGIFANSTYSYKKILYLKIIFGITGLMDRFNLMMPIARLLDLFKIGESYVVVFRRL